MAEALPYRIPMYSIPDEILDVPEDVAALPDLMGFGNMHDLRQAMVRDGSGALRGLVEQYAAEKDESPIPCFSRSGRRDQVHGQNGSCRKTSPER